MPSAPTLMLLATMLAFNFASAVHEQAQDCTITPCAASPSSGWTDPLIRGYNDRQGFNTQVHTVRPVEEDRLSADPSQVIVIGANRYRRLGDNEAARVFQVPKDASLATSEREGMSPAAITSEKTALIVGEDECCNNALCPQPCSGPSAAAASLPPPVTAPVYPSCCGQANCPGPQPCPVMPQPPCCEPHCPLPLPATCFTTTPTGERIVPFAHVVPATEEAMQQTADERDNTISGILKRILIDSRDNPKSSKSASSSSSSSSLPSNGARPPVSQSQKNDAFELLKAELNSVESDRSKLRRMMQETRNRIKKLGVGESSPDAITSVDQALKADVGEIDGPKSANQQQKIDIQQETRKLAKKLATLNGDITKTNAVKYLEMKLAVQRMMALQAEKEALGSVVDGLEKAEDYDLKQLLKLVNKMVRISGKKLKGKEKKLLIARINALIKRLQSLTKEEISTI